MGTAAPASIFGAWDEASFAEVESYLAKYGIEVLTATEEPGQRHVVADGLLSQDHCSHLIPLDIVRHCAFLTGKELSFSFQCRCFGSVC